MIFEGMEPDQPAAPVIGTHSVSRRFLITLVAQISKSALSFLTGMIVARGLGPTEYGNLAFLIGTFTAIRLVLDFASSQAFFTLAAQRPRSRAFYINYALWFAVFQITLPALLIILLLPQHIVDIIWQSQSREKILLAFLATTLQYLFWPQIVQLGEVVRRTAIAQSLTIAISISQCATIVTLYALGWLTLPIYLAVTIIVFVCGGTVAFFTLPAPWHTDAPHEKFLAVLAEFAAYCKPLIVSMSLQALSGSTEVWLLQHYSGAVAQGYFALGMQISLIGLLVTTALQNIFWREVAELQGSGNETRIRSVYIKTSRALLFTATVPIAFLIPWTSQIIEIILGQKYLGATPVIALMFLYPISQTVATPAIVMFSVMRETRILAILSSGYAILFIICSYLILAPISATVPGLGIGSYGPTESAFALGGKLVVFGIAQAVIWEAWINQRKNWSHDWGHRTKLFIILGGFSMLAWLAGHSAMMWLPPIFALMISGILYLSLVGGLILLWPLATGLPVSMKDVLKIPYIYLLNRLRPK